MFCSIYSSHRNHYKKSNILENYLTEKNWNLIRHSDYYKKEYKIFESLENNILSSKLSFTSELYSSYPPPISLYQNNSKI